MGKTSKPVSILVLDEDLFDSPEVQALKAQGHDIKFQSEPGRRYDLILGRKAWYMDTKHLPYLEKIALPAARKRQDNRERETK